MRNEPAPPIGIDSFWEDADREGSREHPLERELCDRLDALARYRDLIAEAQLNGWECFARQLLRQQAREERVVSRLHQELRRLRDPGEAA